MTDTISIRLPGDPAPGRGFARRLLAKPVAVASIGFVVIVATLCLLAPLIAPYAPLEQDLSVVLQMPSPAHWLGTDALGRDVLSRLLYGGSASLIAAAQGVAVVALLGPVLGMAAGFLGGLADRIISSYITIVIALPSIIILLAVLAVFTSSMTAAMIAFGLMVSAPVARIIRGSTLSVREELFVSAAKIAGVGRAQILFRHILPRLAGPIVVQLSLTACIALVMQGGLAFLGLGISQPDPSWGGGIAEAQKVIFRSQWLFVPYGGILAGAILAFGLLGDAARDATVEAWSSERSSRNPKAAPRPLAPITATVRTPDPLALLSVRHLSVTFKQGQFSAVRDVSFDVRSGEIVGLVGESGSGKTTVVLSLMGLLAGSARVATGVAMMADTDLYSLSEKQFARQRGKAFAYVSQDPMSALDPNFTVGQLMDEVVRRHHPRSSRAFVVARTRELLEMVRLPSPDEVRSKYPFELSGGMAQRVCIAMALSGSPDLLIADEPTTALDVTVQAEILDLLRGLRDSTGMAVLLVTHNLAVVADICERVVVMQSGEVVEDTDVVDLFSVARHPYVRQLVDATPSLLDPVVDPKKPARMR